MLRDQLDCTSEDQASEIDCAMDCSFPPRGIPLSHAGSFVLTSAGSSSSGEPLGTTNSSIHARESLPHFKPAPLPLRTPSKQRPLNALPPQIVIPSASSPIKDFAASSSSPSNDHRITSHFDPRTPFRPHLIAKGHQAMSTSSPVQFSSSPVNEASLPFRLPSGPRLTSKPHYSYAALIGQALMSASTGRLSLNQIYTWISLAYPYFKRGEAGWQNSIRHNLSLNGCFVKIRRDDGEKGKGSWWAIREGDESCFAGGGFQRQGRAGGRKRKGNDLTVAQAHNQSNGANIAGPITSGPEDSDEEVGSPKKKRKPSNARGHDTSSQQHPLPRPHLSDSSINPTSLTQTWVQSAGSIDESHLKATQTGLARRRTPANYPPPGGTKHGPTHQTGTRAQDHPLAVLLAKSGLNVAYPPGNPIYPNTVPHGTTRSDIPHLQSLSLPTNLDDTDDDRSEHSDIEPPLIPNPGCLGSSRTLSPFVNHNPSIGSRDISTESGSHPTFRNPQTEAHITSPGGETPLGNPFEVHLGLTRSPPEMPASDTNATEHHATSPSITLKPGFTFEAPAAIKEESRLGDNVVPETVVKEEPPSDDDAEYSANRELSKFSNLYGDEDHFSSSFQNNVFSSSPISASRTQHQPPPRARTRPSGTPGSSRLKSLSGNGSSRAPSIAGATDLLSRVLESKALRRSGAPTKHMGSGVFPRPTTPVKEHRLPGATHKNTMSNRPTTPQKSDSMEEPEPSGSNARLRTPPPRLVRPPPDRFVEVEEEAMLRKLDKDPQLAAAVSALASLSPNRTPMSHAAFHMSPAAPPPSDLQHYKSSLLPPSSPFRTPARGGAPGRDSSMFTPSSVARAAYDYYDYLGDGTNLAEELDRTFGARYKSGEGGRSAFTPRTPATPITGGLFASANLYQSPSLPSPGWRRF